MTTTPEHAKGGFPETAGDFAMRGSSGALLVGDLQCREAKADTQAIVDVIKVACTPAPVSKVVQPYRIDGVPLPIPTRANAQASASCATWICYGNNMRCPACGFLCEIVPNMNIYPDTAKNCPNCKMQMVR